MGYVMTGYRMGPRGKIEYRRFDSDDLLYGEAQRNGWVDSPDKVPGFAKAREAEEQAKAATAHTKAPEPKLTGEVYGDYVPKRKPGRPRKNV